MGRRTKHSAPPAMSNSTSHHAHKPSRTAVAAVRHKPVQSATQQLSAYVLRNQRVLNGRPKLKILPEMPLDIVHEIFSHLQPEDLLNLLLTCSKTRSVLISRSSLSVWKAALQTYYDYGLPPVPPGLNEIQWANIASGMAPCQKCFIRSTTVREFWATTTSICESCIPHEYENYYEVVRRSIFPAGWNLEELVDVIWPRGVRFHTAFVSKSQLKLLKDNIQSTSGNETLESQFINERKAAVRKSSQFVRDCQAFISRRESEEALERERQARRRRDDLAKHLRDLGYGAEMFYLQERDSNYLMASNFVQSGRDLLHFMSRKFIDDLISELDAKKDEIRQSVISLAFRKRQRLLRAVIQKYVHSRSPQTRAVLPKLPDFCVMPSITHRLIDQRHDHDTSEGAFEDLEKEVPRMCDEWKATQDQQLLQLLPPEPPALIEDVEIEGFEKPTRLMRATTFFNCPHCVEPISYPRILAHECTRQLRPGINNHDDEPVVKLLLNLEAEPFNWKGDRIRGYHADAQAAMLKILDCLVLDPEVTTVDDLDSDGELWLECSRKRCNKAGEKRVAYRWRNALLHGLFHMQCSSSTEGKKPNHAKWTRLEDADVQDANQKALEPRSDHFEMDVQSVICLHCSETFDWYHLREHSCVAPAAGSSDVPKLVFGQDYIRHPDCPMASGFGEGTVELTAGIRQRNIIDLTKDL